MATIPTLNHPERVELDRGGVLLCRRARRSDLMRIVAASGCSDENDEAGAALLQLLLFKWGVTGAEDLIDAETGETVPFKREKERGLGRIAIDAVYDACTIEDVVKALAVISPSMAAQEAESGNSSVSPDGSTGDD